MISRASAEQTRDLKSDDVIERRGHGAVRARLLDCRAATPISPAAGIAFGRPSLGVHLLVGLRHARRRVKVIGRLPGESSCVSLVWAVLDRASRGWRGLAMTPNALRLLQNLRRDLHANTNEEVTSETVTAAA
jgi:hypothetical protein